MDTIKAERDIAKINTELVKLIAASIQSSRPNRWSATIAAITYLSAGAAVVIGVAAVVKLLLY